MLRKPPFATSELGESIAITASRFGVRPSEMLGIEGNTKALLYDMASAVVLFEAEAAAYGDTGGGPSVPPLGKEKKKLIDERFRRQEEIARQQAEMMK